MIKITADSTCDLSAEIIKEMDVSLAALHVIVDDKDYLDGVDITPADIFRFVDEEGKTCKTSAMNVYEYESFFSKFADQYDAVIHINIGSGFSACHQNATIAAAGFKNVHVVDSKNLSSGSGHLVCDAASMAKKGMKAEEICRKLEETAPKIDASFVIEHLDYLYKGGRCSGLEVIGANLLKIRPCIEVNKGKMGVGKKYRGSFERCLEQYVEDKLSGRQVDRSRVFITHSSCPEGTVEKVKAAIRRFADFDEIIETNAGCTISSHCGPNTLGILFKHANGA